MTAEIQIRNAIVAIEQQMRKMISAEVQPYDGGREIWGIAMVHASDSQDLMWPLWLIWGALTDWVETKPGDQPQAESEMLRAAREWLSLNANDSKARAEYLDRWVYDEMKYERKKE